MKNVFAEQKHLNSRTIFAVIALLVAMITLSVAQQRKLPPDYEKKRQALANLEVGVVPLFVLGDLNEDGVVDQQDLKLLREYVAQKNAVGISCMAAADLNEDRAVDAKDVDVLAQILKQGTVK